MSENRACLGTSRTTVSNSKQKASSCNRQNRFFPSENPSTPEEDAVHPDPISLGIPLGAGVFPHNFNGDLVGSAPEGRPAQPNRTARYNGRAGPLDRRREGTTIHPHLHVAELRPRVKCPTTS